MYKALSSIKESLSINGLEIVGIFNPGINNKKLTGIKTMLLIGPKDPNFWQIFKLSKEYMDGKTNPMDRWSVRILDMVAKAQKIKAYYPFDKDQKWPFYSWALECEKINTSPVKLLVHNEKGLLVSFRGALGLNYKIQPAKKPRGVCINCSKPCKTACPAEALSSNGYNVKKCIEYISSSNGKDCLKGCLVRKSCPHGSNSQPSEQSLFHMRSFLNTDLMA